MKLFWWSPLKDIRAFAVEARQSMPTWVRLRMRGGRFMRNFGDELSPLILRALGYTPSWAPLDRADVASIGSLLDLFQYTGGARGVVVWGSGLRGPAREPVRSAVAARVSRFAAVRGPLTREALQLAPDTPLGDPGILAPLVAEGQSAPRTNRPVLLPHYRAWSSSETRSEIRALHAEGLEIAYPSLDPLEVISVVRRAAVVYTSSLHGAIVADAFGVPVVMVRFSGPPLSGEQEFKYRDYFASVGMEPRWVSASDVGTAHARRSVEVAFEESAIRHMASVALRGALLGAAQDLPR